MSKKNIISFVKKLAVGVLTVGMLVAGAVVTPQQAEATGTVDTTQVICKQYTKTEIENYWKTDEDARKAPLEDGYVFGGWFREATDADTNAEELLLNGTAGSYAPLTKSDMERGIPETAYAKFVPAQVLSVKAQNGVDEDSTLGKIDATTVTQISKENPMWVRVMTSQDSENYSSIGFDIRLANKKAPTDSADGDKILETKKVFSKVYVGDTLTDAQDIFGAPSEFVCVWKLDQIDTSSNADKIIYVRPYWYTMDGTKVLGLAKYVHIEDEYKNYISVPVNILSAQDIAAGAVNMTYDYEGLELATDDNGNVLFEAGRVLPEMTFNPVADEQTIYMVGNATTDGTYHTGETIYANIRFKKPTVSTTLNFDMTLVEFGNWNKDIVPNTNVAVWDIKYEVEATTTDPVVADLY